MKIWWQTWTLLGLKIIYTTEPIQFCELTHYIKKKKLKFAMEFKQFLQLSAGFHLQSTLQMLPE